MTGQKGSEEMLKYPLFLSLFVILAGCVAPTVENVGFIPDVSAGEKMVPGAEPQILVSRVPSGPGGDIVLPDATDVRVESFRIEAVGESMVLTEFPLVNAGDDAPIMNVVISYRDSDGAMRTSTWYFSDGEALFEGQSVFLPEGVPVAMSVRVNSALSGDADPGDAFRIDWDDSAGVSAIGLETGRAYDESITTDFVAGVEMAWYYAKPSVNGDVCGTADAGFPGANEMLFFDIDANSGGDVGFGGMFLRLSFTDKGRSNWNRCGTLDDPEKFLLYRAASMPAPIEEAEWSFYAADGTNCDDVVSPRPPPVAFASVTGLTEVISAGGGDSIGYTEYRLMVDTTGASGPNNDTSGIRAEELDLTDIEGGVPIDLSYVRGVPFCGVTLHY